MLYKALHTKQSFVSKQRETVVTQKETVTTPFKGLNLKRSDVQRVAQGQVLTIQRYGQNFVLSKQKDQTR